MSIALVLAFAALVLAALAWAHYDGFFQRRRAARRAAARKGAIR